MSQKVVIIGAGPAGLLLAHYLLKRGNYQVEIYERRGDPRNVEFSQDRTFPIALQERGRYPLRQIEGLENAIISHGTLIKGNNIYRQKGLVRRVSRQKPLLIVDRNQLVKTILEHLCETYSGDSRLSIQFECQCCAIDDKSQTITLQTQHGNRFQVNYDRLIGADGARSQVRNYLVENTGLQCEESYIPDYYKSLFLSQTNPETGESIEPNRIHAQVVDQNLRILLVTQNHNQLNGVILFNEEYNPFYHLSNQEEVFEFFQTHFPSFRPLMEPAEAEALLTRRIARVLTVKCDRFHHNGTILLMGDAAHSVSPSIGEGCNSALEDILIFNQLLNDYQDDWTQVLPTFSKQRVPDAHALKELSDVGFPRQKWLRIEALLRTRIQRFLNRLFPYLVKPFFLDLISDASISYSEILRLNQDWITRAKRASKNSQTQ